MVFKKIIFQNRYVALESHSRPPPFMANTILNFHFDYWNTSLSWLHDIYRNQVEISVSLFSGALCLSQCQGRCSLLLPSRVSHEISWPQMWFHHVCQVLSPMKKSWMTSLSYMSCQSHCIAFFVTFYFIREIYQPGLCLHGGFFEMLESGWKRRNHRNMMFYW